MVPRGASSAYLPLVLLVEDDDSLRSALSFALPLEGFRVEGCTSSEELLRRPTPLRPAVLVVDYRLPGITGLEALEILRRRRINLPAILMTSQPTADVQEVAANLNVTIVEKPLLGSALVEAIREALEA